MNGMKPSRLTAVLTLILAAVVPAAALIAAPAAAPAAAAPAAAAPAAAAPAAAAPASAQAPAASPGAARGVAVPNRLVDLPCGGFAMEATHVIRDAAQLRAFIGEFPREDCTQAAAGLDLGRDTLLVAQFITPHCRLPTAYLKTAVTRFEERKAYVVEIRYPHTQMLCRALGRGHAMLLVPRLEPGYAVEFEVIEDLQSLDP